MMSIRSATGADMPAIRQCHAQTEALMDEMMDLPEVGDRPMLGYFVIEEDGQIKGAAYAEACIEWCQIGTDPQVTAALRQFQENIFRVAAASGHRSVHVMVPARLGRRPRIIQKMANWLLRLIASRHARLVGKHLEKSGFCRTGNLHYSRWLGGFNG